MHDTDTLLALVSSLLPSQVSCSASTILDALVQCDGHIQATVDRIIDDSSKRELKRKRVARLSDWLSPSSSKVPRIAEDAPSSAQIKTSTSRSPTRMSPSTPKPTVNLVDVLRPPPSPSSTVPRLPPLTLSNSSLVKSHVPCTLHPSILPPELACRLFHELLDSSTSWKRNKWWLFDRMVESPHRTSFFARQLSTCGDDGMREAAQYWYNGRPTEAPPAFSPAMEEACVVIEQVVNAELSKRKRLPLEYPGLTWRANVAASNRYEGAKESVGAHSDAMTYLGPYPTIASLSLGTQRVFRLREVVPVEEANLRHARTYNIPLPHNSLIIMHASCQERFKHSIPPQAALDLFHPPFPPPNTNNTDSSSERTPAAQTSNVRINLTFRFFRPDFHPSTTPRCNCGVPASLRHDMKRRDGRDNRYWWTCAAAAQREGKSCKFWKELNMEQEGRVVGKVVDKAKTEGSSDLS